MSEHAEGLTPAVFTKWCPKPGPMTMAVVEAAIDLSCQRLGVETDSFAGCTGTLNRM